MLDEIREKISNYFDSKSTSDQMSEIVVRTYSGEDTWAACAAYIPFVSAGVLLIRKSNNEFVAFHAKQALVIHLFSILSLLLLPVTLKFIMAIVIYMILVYGAFQAIRGHKWYLPLVTEIANTFDL